MEPHGTGRYFESGDLAIGITYAKYLTDRLVVGITTKYIYQRIWNETAAGFAFDIGTEELFQPWFYHIVGKIEQDNDDQS